MSCGSCAGGANSSAIPTGTPGQPYTYDGHSRFVVDTRALAVVVIDPATHLETLAGSYNKPGSFIEFFNIQHTPIIPPPPPPPPGTPVPPPIPSINGTVISRAVNPMTGVMESITAQVPEILYPGQPNPQGTIDLTKIPLIGICFFTPCLALHGGPFRIGQIRSCSGDSPGFIIGTFDNSQSWKDVTRHFGPITLEFQINNSITVATTTTIHLVDSHGTISDSTVIGGSTTTATGSNTRTFQPAPRATVDDLGPPPPPIPGHPTATRSILGRPLMPLTPGTFRMFKCDGCCDDCFYLLQINFTTGFTGTGNDPSTPTIDVNGNYSDSGTSSIVPLVGASVSTISNHTETFVGKMGIDLNFRYIDQGLGCNAKQQDDDNPLTLWGLLNPNLSSPFHTTTSNVGSQTIITTTTGPSGGTVTTTSPYAGPLGFSGLVNPYSDIAQINTCELGSAFTFEVNTILDVKVVTEPTGTVTTTTTTIDDGTPTIKVVNSGGGPAGTHKQVETNTVTKMKIVLTIPIA